MQWPTVEELTARAPLQPGYRYACLTRAEIPALIDALQQLPECHSITLDKQFGQTVLAVDDPGGASWQWPAR